MNVWIVADTPRGLPGGMRRHMELHAEGLERVGARARVFYAEDLRLLDGAFPRLPGARGVAALLSRYRGEQPDVVNAHTQCAPGWIAAREAGLLRSKVVVMSYSADEPQIFVRRPRDVLRWARAALPARWAFPRANGVWCVNQQDAEYYVEAYGIPRARIGRFPHAVADSFLEPSAAARSGRRLLFVGSWIKRKGVDVLTAALERVLAAEPDVEIVFAGTVSGQAAVRSGLPPKVAERARVLDTASDAELAELYRSSALLLLPSRVEGLPISMLEAMACGCPPLAAANSGMLDVVVPDANGWLEVSFDPERWAARILALLERPHALLAASAGARASAEEFRVERVAKRVAEWYARLV